MTQPTLSSYEMAVQDFQRARRQATMRRLLTRMRGKSDELLCFDEVRRHLRTGRSIEHGLQEIPLDKIVGSVGRSQDFTRSFLPVKASDQERWARVKAAITDMKGVPPIDLFQLGDAFFVSDGNHRVSVARQLGSKTISAYVTEIELRVPLTAEDDPDEVICKARYADFLEQTDLDKLRPEADLLMTLCGQYPLLLKQIEAECCVLSEDGSFIQDNWPAAVEAWYDNVYVPVIEIIRELGAMRRFPERTETDIYVILAERREELEEVLGWRLDRQEAVPALIDEPQQAGRPLLNRVLESVAPALEDGPEIGRWRRQRLAVRQAHHLFAHILVLLEGIEDDWRLLEQVVRFSHTDHDHILGLYIAHSEEEAHSPAVGEMRQRFELRCQEAGLSGEFSVEIGRFEQVIVRRAAWVDLVVINLTHPPDLNPLARLRSGWGTIIQRCTRPILAIPHAVESTQDRVMLAYDGSAKADEALFVATYLTVRWSKQLTVLTVETPNTNRSALEKARTYLEQHGIEDANYIYASGPIHQTVMQNAADQNINLLIVGGFGLRPALRVVLGSTVEYLLREYDQPMLICR